MSTVIVPLAFILISTCVFVALQSLRSLADGRVRRRLAMTDEEQREAPGWFVESFAAQLPLIGDPQLLETELVKAGFYQARASKAFLALRNSTMIAAVGLTAIVIVILGPERADFIRWVLLAGSVVTSLLWALPRIYLRSRAQRRVERISRALPFAVDIVTMCVSGGLSLRDALTHVSDEIRPAYPELAGELAILQRQADMTSLEIAVRQFAKRIDTPEVITLAALLSQSQQLGTNVASTMREYAEGIRLKWRQRAEEKSGKTTMKMLFPIAFCLLPAAFIILWGPAVLEMSEFLANIDERLAAP